MGNIKIYQAKKLKKICVDCGKKLNCQSICRCSYCLKKQKKGKYKHYISEKGKKSRQEKWQQKKAQGICIDCDKKLDCTSITRCSRCLEKQRMRVYKYKRTKKGQKAIELWSKSEAGKKSQQKKDRVRRARKNNVKIEQINFKIIMLKQDNTCVGCNTSFDLIKPTLDHIIPISKGGPHSQANTQFLCRPCNSSKGTKSMQEFMMLKKLW